MKNGKKCKNTKGKISKTVYEEKAKIIRRTEDAVL